MRRLILFGFVLLAVSVRVKADPVTPRQAAAVAERFLSAESPATKTANGSLRLTGTWPQVRTKGAASEPALFLFERDGGGYVVVAADDCSIPVIGYSATGRLPIDQLPCNLRSMLDWHASMIDYARNQHLPSPEATKTLWLSAAAPEGEGVLLETAHWNQVGHPYYDMIPTLNGESCPAGCVALALAIIMRYHQWPLKGTGTLPGYYWEGGKTQMEGHDLGYAYDWSQMPLIFQEGQYTEEQGRQVARLLYDLAIMSEMEFSPGESSARADAELKLPRYFGYDKQIRFLDWNYYTKDVWEDMIRAELDLSRPVYYGGVNKRQGGHAFVVDGYKGFYFSLNYGWGHGSEYYLLRPSVSLPDEKVTEFCQWSCMATHIYPDQGGEAYPVFVFDAFTPFPWDFRSKSFTIGSRTLEAYSSEVVEVPMGYALFDRKGRFKEILCDPVLVRSDNPRIPEVTCNIPSTIEEGDCLKLALQVNGVWTPINETTRSFVEFHPGKKLSEIICLDHTILDEIYSLFDFPYLYLRGEKAVYWEIWSADEDVCMATSRDISRYGEVGDELYFVLTKWDSDANQYRVEFNFPPGNYRLLLRNFDEEITATIKM